MNKRIISGLAALLMVVSSAGYLPADTFGGYSGTIRASAFEQETVPDNYTLFTSGVTRFELDEITEWNTVETAYQFGRTVDWEHVYDLKKLVVRAKVTNKSAGVNYSDIRSTVYTMNGDYTHWCDAGYHNFNDSGELEFTVDVTPEIFSFGDSEDITLDAMGLQFQLEPDRISGVAKDSEYDYVDIEYSVYTVDSGITDEYLVLPVRFDSNYQGELLSEGILCMDLTELENNDGYCFIDEKIKAVTGFDELDGMGELVLQVKERASSVYDDFDFTRIKVGLFTKTDRDGTVLTSAGNVTERENQWSDYELTVDGSEIKRPAEGSFEGLYFRAFAEDVTADEIEQCRPKVYLQYRVLRTVKDEEMFTYEVIDENSCRITGLKIKSSDISVPSYIGQYRVTELADEAFKDADLTSCELSSSVTRIGKRAFEGNPRLKWLYLSSGECELDEYSVGFNEDGVVNPYFTLECPPFSDAAKYAAINGIRSSSYSENISLPSRGSVISDDGFMLRSDMTLGNGEVAWVRNYQYDTPSWPPSIEELTALKRLFLDAAIDKTADGFSPEDFAAAIFTVDSADNMHRICDTDFDSEGRLSASASALSESFDPDSTGAVKDFGILVYLKPSAVSKLDTENPRQNLAHVQVKLAFNNSAYDPGDFTFPEVEGELRDNYHDSVYFYADPENGTVQNSFTHVFMGDQPWADIYREWRWVIQTHLTYLQDGLAPTDLRLTLFGTDQETGEEISVTVPFDSNGYAMIDSYVNKSFFLKAGTDLVSEFGYRISADEEAFARLGDDAESEAEYDIRIFTVNDIPQTEDGKLVTYINEWDTGNSTSLYFGSWKLFKEREGMKLSGKLTHLPEGLSCSDFTVTLQNGISEGTVATLMPDADGNITFEQKITDELFKRFSNNVYELDICLSLKDPSKAKEFYDYAVLEYETEYENEVRIITEGDYKIAVYSDGTAAIVEYTGNAEELTVPAKIAGYDIDTIGLGAFQYRPELKKLTISEGIKELEENAFSWCFNLKEISLPDSLTKICSYAFSGCGAESLTIPENVKDIGAGAFFESMSLTSVTLPDSIEQLGPSVFAHCPDLKNVKLPANINRIPDYMFADTGIEEIALPDSVRMIGTGAFYYCSQLKKAVLPEGLEVIEENAFANTALEYVVIPETARDINGGAFTDCKALKYAVILGEDTNLNVREDFDYSGSEPAAVYTLPFDKGITLRGLAGSTAEAFAAENGIAFKEISKDDGGFDDPEYTFDKDKLTVTAERFCYLDPESSETETAAVSVDNKPADCQHYASTEYSAEFRNKAFSWSTADTGSTLSDHTAGEPQQENLDPETGEYDLVTRCTVCGEVLSSEHIDPNAKYIIGDVNGDGEVNRIDANLLSRYVAGWEGYDKRVDLTLCDLNGDGDVNRIDANILSRCVADWDGYKAKYIRPRGEAPRT